MDGERSSPVTRTFREWTQFAILLFATAWGVYTFVYKETILPARRPATLAVTASLEDLGTTDGKVLVRLRVQAVNRNDRRVYVPALWYSVWGYRLVKLDGKDDEYLAQIKDTPQAEIQARHSGGADGQVVAVGTFRNHVDDYYDPTLETANEVLFEVPADRYDALYVRTQYFLTRDIDGLALSGWDVDQGGNLMPQLLLSNRPYDPRHNPQHNAWAVAAGAGYASCSTTLSVRPKSSPPPAPATSTDPRVATRP